MMKSVLFVALLVALASLSSAIQEEDTSVPEELLLEDAHNVALEGASEATEVQESAHFFNHIKAAWDKHAENAAKHVKKHAKKDDGRRRRAAKAVEKHVKDAKKAAEKHAEKIKKHFDGIKEKAAKAAAKKKHDDMKERAAKKAAAKKKHFDECSNKAKACDAKAKNSKNGARLHKAYALHAKEAEHHKKEHAYHHAQSKDTWWKFHNKAMATFHHVAHGVSAEAAASLKKKIKEHHRHCGVAFVKCMKPKRPPVRPPVRRL